MYASHVNQVVFNSLLACRLYFCENWKNLNFADNVVKPLEVMKDTTVVTFALAIKSFLACTH